MEPPIQKSVLGDPNGRISAATICLIILTVCVAGAVLTALRSVITPVLIGLILFFLIHPVILFFEERKAPAWLAYLVITLTAIAAIYGLGWFIQTQSHAFQEWLPNYYVQMDETLNSYAQLVGLADSEGKFNWRRYGLIDLVPISQEDLFRHLFGMTLEALESAALAVFYLLFMLIESRRWAARTWNTLENESAAKLLSAVGKMRVDIWNYLMVKTFVSAGLGITTAITCLAFGVDFWPLWGFVMFLANYVTYVGSILALAPPILIAFVQFSNPVHLAGVAVALIAVRFVWIDYVEIRYSGMHINISPLLLLFSLALLGWMWGVVGLLLAIPLVTTLRIALDSNSDTAFMARLMSDDEETQTASETVGI